jgi:ABC-type transport system involved in cytochrome c biogenesis ATPase subunit
MPSFKGTEWHINDLAKHYAQLAMHKGWQDYVKEELAKLEEIEFFQGVTEKSRQEWRRLHEAKNQTSP